MSKALISFALVAVLTALLMALSLAVARHGYPYGAIGVRRLDGIADAGTFIPLAAVYFFTALLMMILPIRAASIVLTHAADAIFWTVIVLLATIVGGLLARWAFGQGSALLALLNWRFLFAVVVRLSLRHERAAPQRAAAQPVLRGLRRRDAGLPVLVLHALSVIMAG